MAEFQSKFTGQEVDNAIDKLRTWIGVDGTYPTVTISGVTYAVIWKSIPVSGTPCYGIGLHPTTGRIYEIYYEYFIKYNNNIILMKDIILSLRLSLLL